MHVFGGRSHQGNRVSVVTRSRLVVGTVSNVPCQSERPEWQRDAMPEIKLQCSSELAARYCGAGPPFIVIAEVDTQLAGWQ
ncbi:unnamed protein product, partial [Iphiclides podalirius]